MNAGFRIGGLVKAPHLKTPGIVIAEAPRPDAKWIRDQHNPRIREVGEGARWLSIMLLEGGKMVYPEILLLEIGPASYEDFLVAVEHGNEHAVRTLATTFPEWAARAARNAGLDR